jgi:fatty acid desaturase
LQARSVGAAQSASGQEYAARSAGAWRRRSEARSQKGPLAFVRSKNEDTLNRCEIFWLLASGFWLLASGFWLLASGFWLLASGFWLLASGF